MRSPGQHATSQWWRPGEVENRAPSGGSSLQWLTRPIFGGGTPPRRPHYQRILHIANQRQQWTVRVVLAGERRLTVSVGAVEKIYGAHRARPEVGIRGAPCTLRTVDDAVLCVLLLVAVLERGTSSLPLDHCTSHFRLRTGNVVSQEYLVRWLWSCADSAEY